MFNTINFILKNQGSSSHFDQFDLIKFLIGHGELYIVSTTLCAVAFGELVEIHSQMMWQTLSQYVLGFICLVLICGSVFCYAQIPLNAAETQVKWLIDFSINLFFLAVIVSSCIIFISD